MSAFAPCGSLYRAAGRCRSARIAFVLVLLFCLAGLAAAGPAAAAEHPYNQGCKALAAGDIARATAFFKEAVKLDPKDTDALNNLAVCYIKSRDYARALPLLSRVLRVNSRYKGADLNTGADYLFRGDVVKAKPSTERARNSLPTKSGKAVEAAALFNLGLIEAQAGRYAKAQTCFEKSDAAVSSIETDIALACAQSAQGQYDEGITALKKVADAKPGAGLSQAVARDLAVAYYRRGMKRLDDGNIQGAADDFSASNDQAANDYARMGLALVDAERGDTDAAAGVLGDLKKNASSAQLANAASENLARVSGMASGEAASWIYWLALIGGGVLFALQAYLVSSLAAAGPSARGAQPMVALGAIAGVAAAVILALAFFGVLTSSAAVLAAFGADAAVVVVLWVRQPKAGRSAGVAG